MLSRAVFNSVAVFTVTVSAKVGVINVNIAPANVTPVAVTAVATTFPFFENSSYFHVSFHTLPKNKQIIKFIFIYLNFNSYLIFCPFFILLILNFIILITYLFRRCAKKQEPLVKFHWNV